MESYDIGSFDGRATEVAVPPSAMESEDTADAAVVAVAAVDVSTDELPCTDVARFRGVFPTSCRHIGHIQGFPTPE